MSYQEPDAPIETIAIIGMSGRFPGAGNIEKFWQNLCDGVESISFFSDETLLATNGVDPALLDNPDFVKAKGIIEDVDLFDASFFDLSPREAEFIDPQHRLFLECAWEALENAGYDPHTYPGAIGVYAGSSLNTYLLNNITENQDAMNTVDWYQIMLSNDKDFLSTRVSYKLNLTGPSLNIQTACSTSLVAVQMACQSLLDYQCDMALAGGVSISFPHQDGYLYQEGMIFSPDGHCRAFDAAAGGIVVGEGVGLVALKRLSEALADGDHIYAVIKGSAINNDGSLKVGYTAPSVEGQAQVIATAQAIAGVDPATVTYVETHGTGTILGDPIEISALNSVFQAKTGQKGFCAIGSVKTNIGHLDTAAGIAGLIKTALALKHKLIPASLHFENPNPKINFADSPFYVNTKLTKWKTGPTPRRAGVSAFGIGGTNAHVVLEEAPIPPKSSSGRTENLLLLSAKTSSALEKMTQNLAAHLKQHPHLNLTNVAYTLQVGRRAFAHRRMLVCHNAHDAVQAIETGDTQRILTSTRPARRGSVVFMFTGQGSQYVTMAQELYQLEPIFRRQVDFCATFLQPILGFDLRHILYPLPEHFETATQQLLQTAVTQLALFVIEYALAKLWQAWGIQPEAMIGHSIGEYVAACLAGVFSVEEALGLVATRGRLMQAQPGGSMLAVSMPEEQVKPYLGPHLSLAAVNGPAQCVVSGPKESINSLEAQLAAENITCRQLFTSHAFHSEMMAPMLEPYLEQVKAVALKPPQIPFISNVTGTWITASQATSPDYWGQHLRQGVRFAAGVQTLLAEPDRIFLEIGPGNVLASLVRQQINPASPPPILSSLRHPQNDTTDRAFLLNTLGQLWLNGAAVNWEAFYGDKPGRRVPLPTYPFERQRYLIEPQEVDDADDANQPQIGYVAAEVADWFYQPAWKQATPPEFFAAPLPAPSQSNWLIFTDEGNWGAKMARQLQELGHNVVQVMIGATFKQIGPAAYTLNPNSANDYHRLFAELHRLNRMPHLLTHFWSLTTADQPLTAVSFEKGQKQGFYSLIFIAQAINKLAPAQPLKIQVVSNGLHPVTGDEILRPEKSTLSGPCRVIPIEYPQIQCRHIDIILPPPNSSQETRLINLLIAETALTSAETVVAYRGSHRWSQTLEACRMNANTQPPARLKKAGVYLVTGGLSEAGMSPAEYLAQTVGARLILTTPDALPAREQWREWPATHSAEDKISRAIRNAQILENRGASILIVNADITRADQVQAVVAQARRQFGPIQGVIHAANGTGEKTTIQLTTPEQAAHILAPQVEGTLALEQALAAEPLDFFILCSSISSIMPVEGQASQCAANAFLDAFAQSRRGQNGAPCTSINWNIRAENGASANATSTEPQQGNFPENGLSSQDGQKALERILHYACPQVLVSKVPPRGPVENGRNAAATTQPLAPPPAPDSFGNGITGSAGQQPALPQPTGPQDSLEAQITAIWQNLLGLESIGINDNFFELGGHSLLAMRLFSQIEKTLHRKFPVALLFQLPTIKQMADYLREKEHQPALRALVTIRAQGDRPPFFFIHAIGGFVMRYRDLAQAMGKDQPVYALQSIGIDLKQTPHNRVEEMAAHYIKEMQSVQPHGPYFVGGLSFGGIVAYEIACQLQAQGQPVGMVAIFDTMVFQLPHFKQSLSWQKRLSFHLKTVAAKLNHHAQNLKNRSSGQKLQYVQTIITEGFSSLLNTGEDEDLPVSDNNPAQKHVSIATSRTWQELQGFNIEANNHYIPKHYHGNVILFHITKNSGIHYGWEELVDGKVEIYIVPGTHTSLIEGRSAFYVASKLRELMDRAQP